MIVRILGEGQMRVDDAELSELNRLDDELTRAIDSGDDARFRAALAALLARVREVGTPLPADALEPSELILPDGEAHVDDVKAMLGGEGLIPG